MKLYHGTAERFLPTILRDGLKPRGSKRRGNWKHSVEGNTKAIYLTNAYPLHYAGNATVGKERMLVLEIDTAKLNPFRFAPDEDFLEQATRGNPNFADIQERWPGPQGMHARTKWFRRCLLTSFAEHWEKSLEHLGNCTYFGTIPPEAILRYSLVDVNAPISRASDPCIHLANYRILGHYYRALTQFVFNENIGMCDANDTYMSHLAKLPRDGIVVVQP